MNFRTLTENEFKQGVLQSNQQVCLIFGANWSGSFYLIQPTLNEFVKNNNGLIKFIMLDYDSNKWLAEQSGIYFHVPSILIYNNGQLTNQAVGLISCLDLLIELQKKNNISDSRRGHLDTTD